MMPEINLEQAVHKQSEYSADCTDSTTGRLPSCAPLAVPFIPVQEGGGQRYSRREALQEGTLFPGLDLPFRLKKQGIPVENTPLAELQAIYFVLLELGLYLDTHPTDTEAAALYKQYSELEAQGRAKYEERYGPLTQLSAVNKDRYTWLDDPWPWEKGRGQ